MTLFIEDESLGGEGSLLAGLPLRELAEAAAEKTLEMTGCPFDCQAALLITDAQGIRGINAEQRNIDAVTDVLSFPALEISPPGCFDSIDPDCPGVADPESGELILGDIAVCAERVREQAEAYGHSEKREFSFLIVHSMLHLIGYDHETPDGEKEMFRLQEEILNALNITRNNETQGGTR